MTRKAMGPNGIAIVRSDAYPSDEELIDRAMQVGHLTAASIVANRAKLLPEYEVLRSYELDPTQYPEDMWFEVAEDIADQHRLSFDGIERAFHEDHVVCRLGGEKYLAAIQSDRTNMHRAMISTLKTYHRI